MVRGGHINRDRHARTRNLAAKRATVSVPWCHVTHLAFGVIKHVSESTGADLLQKRKAGKINKFLIIFSTYYKSIIGKSIAFKHKSVTNPQKSL